MALGWGDNTWGDYGWGGAIPVTGNGAVSTVGTATPIVSVAITGVDASGAVGTVVQNQSVSESGNSATASVGAKGLGAIIRGAGLV